MTDITFHGTPVKALDIQRSVGHDREGLKTTTRFELTFEDGRKAWMTVSEI